MQVWYLILSALALATVINICSKMWAWYSVRFPASTLNSERKGYSILRLLAALLTAARTIAFRWRIPMGSTFTMSFFEIFVSITYLSALLIWEFVHSKFLRRANSFTTVNGSVG